MCFWKIRFDKAFKFLSLVLIFVFNISSIVKAKKWLILFPINRKGYLSLLSLRVNRVKMNLMKFRYPAGYKFMVMSVKLSFLHNLWKEWSRRDLKDVYKIWYFLFTELPHIVFSGKNVLGTLLLQVTSAILRFLVILWSLTGKTELERLLYFTSNNLQFQWF